MKRFKFRILSRILWELIVVALIAVPSFLFLRQHHSSGAVEPPIDEQIDVGDSLAGDPAFRDVLPPIALRDSVVVLVVDSECAISRQQFDFHVELLNILRGVDGTSVLINAVRKENGHNITRVLVDMADIAIDLDPREIGVFQTPLIMLLRYGKVEGMWIGHLFERQSSAVVRRIIGEGHTITHQDRPDEYLEVENDLALREFMADRGLLDVRSREDYEQSPNPRGAKNVPMHELWVRAQIEFNNRRNIVVDCSQTRDSECQAAGFVLAALGFSQVSLLDPGVFSVACQASRYFPDTENGEPCSNCGDE